MAKKKPRTVEEIRADLANNRAKMAASMDALVDEVNPKNIAKRGVKQAQGFVTDEFNNVKSQFKDERGNWRMNRVLAVGGAVLGAVALIVTLNVMARNRRNKSLEMQLRRALEVRPARAAA